MNLLLFVALSLSFVGPSLAVDEVVEDKMPGNAHRKIALLSVEKWNASILGDGRFLGNFSTAKRTRPLPQ